MRPPQARSRRAAAASGVRRSARRWQRACTAPTSPCARRTAPAGSRAWGWWASRWGSEAQDLYLFLHGADHKAGLRSLASVSGRSAVPPRRFFGVWWSRWNKYTTQELRDMAAAYEANALPL